MRKRYRKTSTTGGDGMYYVGHSLSVPRRVVRMMTRLIGVTVLEICTVDDKKLCLHLCRITPPSLHTHPSHIPHVCTRYTQTTQAIRFPSAWAILFAAKSPAIDSRQVLIPRLQTGAQRIVGGFWRLGPSLVLLHSGWGGRDDYVDGGDDDDDDESNRRRQNPFSSLSLQCIYVPYFLPFVRAISHLREALLFIIIVMRVHTHTLGGGLNDIIRHRHRHHHRHWADSGRAQTRCTITIIIIIYD